MYVLVQFCWLGSIACWHKTLALMQGGEGGRSLVKVSKVGFMLPWWRERWSLDCPCFSYDTVHTCGQCVPNTVEEVTWEMSLTNKAF